MSLQSKIQSSLQFDNENIPNDFSNTIDLTNKNFKFGVLSLKISKIDPVIKKRHIIFTTDCSGSMSDICNDGRSKMEHSNHTLINMIIYFAMHTELLVSISVFAFDCSLYTVIENEVVTKDNLDKLIQDVKNIRPKDTTDIEKALKNSSEYISKFNFTSLHDDTNILHVFMTDGDATQGETNSDTLQKLVSPLVSNIFIGFGVDHNAYLLKELSSDSSNCYYFVDALEKAGLVYGEILHAFIYKYSENTTISTTNGLLYDWKKNTWVDKINIGDLVSETSKTIHILSETPIDIICELETTDYLTKKVTTFTVENSLTSDENNVVNGYIDLSKYKYRQRTQELLFEVNVHNFKDNYVYCDPIKFNHYDKNYENFWEKQKVQGKILKEKMQNLLKEMQQNNSCVIDPPFPPLEKVEPKSPNSEDFCTTFSKSGNEANSKDFCTTFSKSGNEANSKDFCTTFSKSGSGSGKQFIKMLCDDIYVCLQTFDTKYGAMYSCARQVSQGAQRSYSANHSQNYNHNHNFNSPPKLMRSYNYAHDIYTQQENEDDISVPLLPDFGEDEIFKLSLNIPTNNSNIQLHDNSDNNTNIKIRDTDYNYNSRDTFDDYKVSDQIDNPYTNDSVLELMRICSASLDDNKLFR
jgi:hypothetical protein